MRRLVAAGALGALLISPMTTATAAGAPAAPGASPPTSPPTSSPTSFRTFPAPSSTSRVGPELAAVLAGLTPGAQTRVVVTLRDRANLAGTGRGGRAARLKGVILSLQSKATTSQRPIRARLAVLVRQGRVSAVTPLWVVNGVSLSATADVVRELAARPDVASIRPDAIDLVPSAAPAQPNVTAVQAPALWDLGMTGQGVVVATLDSGVDVSHPDLATRWRGGTNSWYDPYGQHLAAPVDLSGHGTATMGVIVGGDSSGTSVGMAPGASWIAARIFNDQGAATTTALHQAFQWLLDPDGDPTTPDAPHVVNGSFSIGSAPGCDLSIQPDVQALSRAGILPVFAAGNYGPAASTSVSPANYPESLAVGAVDGTDTAWYASSSGPSTCGGRATTFPDVVAPGLGILTTDRFGLMQTVTGTSIASPHVAGALALLLGAAPGLSPERQRAALTGSALDLGTPGPDPRDGFGRIDVAAAKQWLDSQPDFAVDVAPASATVQPGGSTTYSVHVTAIHEFTGDVSLTLGGLDAGQATWSLTPAVVAAGGTAELTVSTSSAIPPGSYALTVTASSGTIARTGTAALEVLTPADFALSAGASTLALVAGAGGTVGIDVGSLGGFVDTVSLAATGFPDGVGTASISPSSISGSGSTVLRVTTLTGAPPGSYPVTVTGSTGTLTHSAQVTVQVTAPPDFSVGVPATATVNAGAKVTLPLSIASLNGFTGTVQLASSGLAGAVGTSTLTPATITGQGNASLTLTAAASAPGGTYAVTVTATSGSLRHTARVDLTVVARDFALTATPAAVSVARGGIATYVIAATGRGGMVGKVTLSRSTVPAATSSTWSSNPVVIPGTSSLRIRTTSTTKRGSYTVVVTGTSGTLTHRLAVTLTVT